MTVSQTFHASRLADRMSRLGTESAFEVLARARALEAQGRRIIHLEIGEPDCDTPRHIVDAAAQALHAGFTHYVPAPGLMETREAVASWLSRTGRLETSPDRVIVTPGAKPIMWYLMLATCQEGDEVIYPDPGFPMYESIANFVGATPVPLPLREENQFRPDPDELARLVTPRTRLLVLNSPHNPCGSALSTADCEAIADIAIKNDLLVLSDEVYWAIRYEGSHASVLDVPGMAERTVLLDGWSKTFAMTGWRLGFGVFPPALVEPVCRLVINSVSCTSAFSQRAAIAALTGPWDPIEQMIAEFAKRRDVIVQGLNDIDGVTCVQPGGAFYAFPSVKSFGIPSKKIEEHLLNRAGVAALSGTAFGRHGEGYLRFSYANSVQAIREALDAVAAALPELEA
jgi:aspartate aminotransferase